MAVANKESALSRVASDPVSRRRLLAVTDGSTAFLAGCGSGGGTTTATGTAGGRAEGPDRPDRARRGRTRRSADGSDQEAGRQARRRAEVRLPLQRHGGFLELAQTFEDTGVSAFNGAAPQIKSKEVLGAAGSIVQVEARHAAAIRRRNGDEPAPLAFDPALSEAKVLKAVEPFIQ